MPYWQTRIAASTSHGSRASRRTCVDASCRRAARPRGRAAGCVAAPGGYAVSVGPRNCVVCATSRQWSGRARGRACSIDVDRRVDVAVDHGRAAWQGRPRRRMRAPPPSRSGAGRASPRSGTRDVEHVALRVVEARGSGTTPTRRSRRPTRRPRWSSSAIAVVEVVDGEGERLDAGRPGARNAPRRGARRRPRSGRSTRRPPGSPPSPSSRSYGKQQRQAEHVAVERRPSAPGRRTRTSMLSSRPRRPGICSPVGDVATDVGEGSTHLLACEGHAGCLRGRPPAEERRAQDLAIGRRPERATCPQPRHLARCLPRPAAPRRRRARGPTDRTTARSRAAVAGRRRAGRAPGRSQRSRSAPEDGRIATRTRPDVEAAQTEDVVCARVDDREEVDLREQLDVVAGRRRRVPPPERAVRMHAGLEPEVERIVEVALVEAPVRATASSIERQLACPAQPVASSYSWSEHAGYSRSCPGAVSREIVASASSSGGADQSVVPSRGRAPSRERVRPASRRRRRSRRANSSTSTPWSPTTCSTRSTSPRRTTTPAPVPGWTIRTSANGVAGSPNGASAPLGRVAPLGAHGRPTTAGQRGRRRAARATPAPPVRRSARLAARPRGGRCAPAGRSGGSRRSRRRQVRLEDAAQAGVDLLRPVPEGRAVAAALELVIRGRSRASVGDLAHALRRRLHVLRERHRVDRRVDPRAAARSSRTPGRPATAPRASRRRGRTKSAAMNERSSAHSSSSPSTSAG